MDTAIAFSVQTLAQALSTPRWPIVLGVRREAGMLEHGMVMYDAPCRWCKECKHGVRTRNPEAYR
jgi:hypothetical protein